MKVADNIDRTFEKIIWKEQRTCHWYKKFKLASISIRNESRYY